MALHSSCCLAMPFFSRKSKAKSKRDAQLPANGAGVKSQWSDAWLRTRVDPEEVVELLRGCTQELKSRGQ